MNIKSFIIGIVTGVLLTFAVAFFINKFNQSSDSVQYLEKPVSYESKKETSFKVFQAFSDAALASELSYDVSEDMKLYNGNTVLILGENFYTDQEVIIKNPQRVGTYSYTNKGGMPMTVPVVDGDIR